MSTKSRSEPPGTGFPSVPITVVKAGEAVSRGVGDVTRVGLSEQAATKTASARARVGVRMLPVSSCVRWALSFSSTRVERGCVAALREWTRIRRYRVSVEAVLPIICDAAFVCWCFGPVDGVLTAALRYSINWARSSGTVHTIRIANCKITREIIRLL